MVNMIYITCPKTGAKVPAKEWPAGTTFANLSTQLLRPCPACTGSPPWSLEVHGYRDGESAKRPPPA